jgi:hypothetical protein
MGEQYFRAVNGYQSQYTSAAEANYWAPEEVCQLPEAGTISQPMEPVNMTPIIPQPTPPLRALGNDDAVYFKIDTIGAASAEAFSTVTRLQLAAGQSSSWVVINLSGLKFINDNGNKYPGGHEAGNAYLTEYQKNIRLAASLTLGIPPEEVIIVRDGPNFAVNVTNEAAGRKVIGSLSVINRTGIEFTYTYKGEKYTKALNVVDLANKTSLFSEGIVTFDANTLTDAQGRVLVSEDAIFKGLREQIYYLNRPELNSGRIGGTHLVGAAEAAILETYSLSVRLVGYDQIMAEARPVLAPQGAANVESRSGLYNVDQMKLDGAALLRRGHSVRFSFFDGNAIGSFRSLGFAGEAMIDSLVEARMAQAAAKAGLAELGVRVYRHGGGSEEFYLTADSEKVSAEAMNKATQRFLTALNSTPFEIRIEPAALQATEAGRRYLAENPQAVRETLNGREYIRVDITRVTRLSGSGQPHRAVTVTMGTGVIKPTGDTAFDNLFERSFKAIMEFGEAAKQANPARRNMIVEVTMQADHAINARIIPLDNAVANPMPVNGSAPTSLIDEAYRNNWTIEVTAKEGKIVTAKVIEPSGAERQIPAAELEAMTTTQQRPAEITGEALGKVLAGEKGKTWFKRYMSTPEGRTFVRQWAKSGAINGASFITSLLAAVGTERLLRELGVTNFGVTFSSSMAVGYGTDIAFRKAFVTGFQAGSLATQARGLGANIVFATLGSSLYNGLLNTIGVNPDSWLRGTVPQLGVGLGTGILGTKFLASSAAGMGPAGAALPFALFATANELIPRFSNSEMELNFKQQVSDEVREGLAREGGFYNNYALFISCVPIFSNIVTFTVDDARVAEKAEAWLRHEASPARADLQTRLTNLWLAVDGPALGIDYDGGPRDAAFFSGVNYRYERVTALMQTRVEFRNSQQVIGERTIEHCDGDFRYGCVPASTTIPVYGPAVREADAYDYFTRTTRELTPEQYRAKLPEIVAKLQSEYSISAPQDFLLRVQVRGIQDEAAFLASSQVAEAEHLSAGGVAGVGTTYHVERGLFNADGTLRAGRATAAVSYANLGDTGGIGRMITEQRKYARTVALAQGSPATPVDIQLGLATANGRVNEQSSYYQTYLNKLTEFAITLANQ